MSATVVTVTGSFLPKEGGGASTGAVSFRLSAPMTNGTIYPPYTYVATLDSTGAFSIALPSTEDSATIPSGVFYYVVFNINSVIWRGGFSLPVIDTIDISLLNYTSLSSSAHTSMPYSVINQQ